MKENHLPRSYSTHADSGTVYHFEHVKRSDAEAMAETAEAPFIVESIVWVSSERDESKVHLNRYFLESLSDAVKFAFGAIYEIGETLVNIRLASDEERKQFKRAARRRKRRKVDAVSD